MNRTQDDVTKIERYVSNMLQATKRLLSLLTGWSTGEVEEEKIFEEYHCLQSYFLQTIELFETQSMDDMLGLPDALYNCLKTTLAQGPEAIEGHLPLIKAAILKLLSAIKSKQSDQTRWDIYLAAQDRVKKVRVSRTELTREGLLALFRDWLGPLGRCSRLYILDSERNVQYELESMEDTIQPYSVISLRDTDTRLTGLRSVIEHALSQALAQENTDSSQTQALREEIERFKSRQVSDAREIKRLRDALAQREDRAMEREQEGWEETMAHVSHRLECLQDNVDQLKTDITQRRCRPSKDRLASCENEAGWLGQQLEIARKELARYRPQWKKQWESELQQIVKEQQRLKAQELHLSDLSEDYRAIGDVLDQAGQISRLHQRKKEKGGEYMRPPAEAGFDGMASVLQQVAMIKVDHAQRLQALEKAQQARAKTLSQRMDAFERELVDFVLLRKLKNTGGPQQIDQQRQITDKTFIQHIFANKQV